MPVLRRQMLGFALAIIGFMGTIIVCVLPMWKVTVFGGVCATQLVIWEGLWITCAIPSPGQRECKTYDPLLDLSQDLRAARVLVVISIIFAAFGVILGIVGGIIFVNDVRSTAKVAIAAGIFFICASVFILIPVCWTADTIIKGMHNPLFITKKKLGAALYLGWGTAGLLILGGALLCSSCPPRDSPEATLVKHVSKIF